MPERLLKNEGSDTDSISEDIGNNSHLELLSPLSSSDTGTSELLTSPESVSPSRVNVNVSSETGSPDLEPVATSNNLSRTRSPVLAESGSPRLIPILPSNANRYGQYASTVAPSPVRYLSDAETDIVRVLNPNVQNNHSNASRTRSNSPSSFRPSQDRPVDLQVSSDRPVGRQSPPYDPVGLQPSSNRRVSFRLPSNRPANVQLSSSRPANLQSSSNPSSPNPESNPMNSQILVSIPLKNLTNIPGRTSVSSNPSTSGTGSSSQTPNSAPSTSRSKCSTKSSKSAKASKSRNQGSARPSASYPRAADSAARSLKFNTSSNNRSKSSGNSSSPMPSTSGTNFSVGASNSPVPSTSRTNRSAPVGVIPENLRSPQPFAQSEELAMFYAFEADLLKRAYITLSLMIGELAQYTGRVPERLPVSFRRPDADTVPSEPKQCDMEIESPQQISSDMEDESTELKLCNKENCVVPESENTQEGSVYPQKRDIAGENSTAVANLLKMLANEEQNESDSIEEPGLTETNSSSGQNEMEIEIYNSDANQIPSSCTSEENNLKMEEMYLLDFHEISKHLPSVELTTDGVGQAVQEIRTHINCFARFLIVECRYPNRNRKYMEFFKLAYTTFKEEEYPRFMEMLNIARTILTAENSKKAEDLFSAFRDIDEYLRKLHYAYFMIRTHQLFQSKLKVISKSIYFLKKTILSIDEWKKAETKSSESDSD